MRSTSDCFWNLFFLLDCPFNNLHFWVKLKHYALVCVSNLQFRLPILPSLLLILLQSEAVVPCCSTKKVFLQIPQNSQKNAKKDIPAQMFSCEFCKVSHNIFFKEPFGQLLHHKYLFCLLSHHNLSPFQKQCHTYFRMSIFSA